jgi:predicted ester cyclase
MREESEPAIVGAEQSTRRRLRERERQQGDPDVLDHSRPPGIGPGAEGVRQQFDGFRQAFPDFRATVLDQIAEGDMVVTRKVFHGTHRGDLMGIPPTGRDVEIHVIDIVRLSQGPDRRALEHRRPPRSDAAAGSHPRAGGPRRACLTTPIRCGMLAATWEPAGRG